MLSGQGTAAIRHLEVRLVNITSEVRFSIHFKYVCAATIRDDKWEWEWVIVDKSQYKGGKLLQNVLFLLLRCK